MDKGEILYIACGNISNIHKSFTVEISTEKSQNTKSRSTIQPSYTSPGYLHERLSVNTPWRTYTSVLIAAPLFLVMEPDWVSKDRTGKKIVVSIHNGSFPAIKHIEVMLVSGKWI